MKKITILLVIIFTFLFSNTSWGEWTYVVKNMKGSKSNKMNTNINFLLEEVKRKRLIISRFFIGFLIGWF